MKHPAPYAGTTFSAPRGRSTWFAEAVLARVDAQAPLRVLDIGCGTGGHVLALAARMPRATFHGVDVSAENIAQAERSRRESAAAGRIAFACADYVRRGAETYDLIVSDSALHLIAAPTEDLFARIAADLAPGGLLIASLPDGGAYNRALWLARRALAALRGPWLDRLALALAARLYRGRHDEAFLRERIPYLYVLPRRFAGRALRTAARAQGLEWRSAERAPHASAMQPVHVLVTWQRFAHE